MIKFFSLSAISILFISSIYTINIKTIDNVNLPLSNFQGKKILIVHTATNSPYVNQYRSLDSLWQIHKDSLVILAFPSNSFGNETANNNQIKNFVLNTYNIHYTLCKKTDVISENKNKLYRWLALPTENGRMNGRVKGDFYKFLIDKSGNVIGEFDGATSPMSAAVQDALKN
jgi:glutathione peroxidase